MVGASSVYISIRRLGNFYTNQITEEIIRIGSISNEKKNKMKFPGTDKVSD